MKAIDAEIYATGIAQVMVVVLAPEGCVVDAAVGTFLVLVGRGGVRDSSLGNCFAYTLC